MSHSDTAFAELVDADNKRYEAMIAADTDALAGILADELLYTHSSGNTEAKEQNLETIRRGTFCIALRRSMAWRSSSAGTSPC